VISGQAAYLVEGKWNSSNELREEVVTVADRQQRRHKVLRWYQEKWRQRQPTSWANFRTRNKTDFESTFPGLTIPTAGTKLATNLEFVLASLCVKDIPLVDVLLFSTIHDEVRPKAVEPPSFRLVVMLVDSVGGDGFIEL